MGIPSVSVSSAVRLSVILSLSVTASYSYSYSSIPKATASDLLCVLTPNCSINPLIARQLNSCLKFLVTPHRRRRRRRRSWSWREQEDELILWPPQPLLDLARLAFDSGGDVAAIHAALDPTPIPVPDVEGSNQNRCQLTRTPYGRRFISEEINLYLGFLFQLIVARGPEVGLNVSLSRYDFFHGHLFLATNTARLGILFHAKEYPAYDKEVFPYNMGYCQRESNVAYDDSMNLRNILWLAPLPGSSPNSWASPGVLVVLDARPEGIIYRDIIPEYVNFARTIYEDDFGDVAVDVNYLNIGDCTPDYQIFIC